jgi:hypothetical protein
MPENCKALATVRITAKLFLVLLWAIGEPWRIEGKNHNHTVFLCVKRTDSNDKFSRFTVIAWRLSINFVKQK